LIDFRYHIVSITAVFLALGIGVAVGATVLDQVSVTALRNQLDALSADLDARRADITALRNDLAQTQAIVRDLAPRVTAGALAGRRILFVDATDGAGWIGAVRRALLDAGAEDAGTLTATNRWEGEGAEEALDGIVADLFLLARLKNMRRDADWHLEKIKKLFHMAKILKECTKAVTERLRTRNEKVHPGNQGRHIA
jgi:outer membrane murein-binding lipoprotein Lpp